jgi:hypothetical protein
MQCTYVDGDSGNGENFERRILLGRVSEEFTFPFVPFDRVECITFQVIMTQ